MSVTNLVNLSTAVNKLFAATQEKGINADKMALLAAASTSLATAVTGDSALTGTVALATVKAAIDQVQFAIDAANGRGNGSGVPTLSAKVTNEPAHTKSAYTLAATALAAPTV